MSVSGRVRGTGSDPLRTLLAYELRMVLRDRRTLLLTVAAPLVLFPAIIFVMRAVERAEERRLEEATYPYAVDGTPAVEVASWVRDALVTATAERDTAQAPFRFEERPAGNADSLLAEGDLQLVVRAFTPEAYRETLAAERAERTADAGDSTVGGDARATVDAAGPDGGDAPEVPVIRLLFRTDSDLSRTAAERMESALLGLREARRVELYRTSGLPVDPDEVASLEAVNVASAEREGGAILGLALTPLLLFLMLSGGSIVATDAIAGEKERGTLETLLTTAATRTEIVAAKLMAIVAVGLAVAVVNVLNLLLYVVVGVVDLPAGFAVSVGPLSLVVTLVLLLPVTLLVASVLLLVSGWAKSYKEYQIYFLPVFLLLLVPSAAGALPGMELRSAISLVPIANIGVAVREVMVGTFDWPFLLVALATTSAAAVGLARLTGRALSTERLISQAELDEADLVGGPALFPRHVLRWFGVLWVLLLVTSLWFGEDLGMRGQVAVNLLGLFLGGSILMIRRYRLPVREALALRPVHPAAWIAVGIGAPSALLVGSGLAHLAELFLPVPERMVEAFGQSLLPEGVPLWQIVLFLSVMPGVCEEVAFRGVLLHGLSKRLRPVALALAVGAIFGLFHVSLFRILPTGYLGVVLAAVTLLTGSIFPAIAWHALNNAVALLPVRLGWVSADLAVEGWMYGAAAAGLLAAFWVLWRVRRPYPVGRIGMRRSATNAPVGERPTDAGGR